MTVSTKRRLPHLREGAGLLRRRAFGYEGRIASRYGVPAAGNDVLSTFLVIANGAKQSRCSIPHLQNQPERTTGPCPKNHEGKRHKTTERNGTTLLELIAVMAIICTVLAMAAPSLRGFFASRRTHNTAALMLTAMKTCRSRAISEGRIYRFHLDPDKETFWITAQNQGVPEEFGRAHTLPDGIGASWQDLPGGLPEYIQFYPDGRGDVARIRLNGKKGEVIELRCPSATEFYAIRAPEAEGNL